MAAETVLVVDNEVQVQELIQTYLSRLNLDIHAAYSGEEAVELYRELLDNGNRPDMVIMDLNLSESGSSEALRRQMEGTDDQMDGVAATQAILDVDPDAAIIGFTAFAGMEWGDRLKQAGAMAVYGRNIGFDGLADRVGEILAVEGENDG